MFRTLALTTLAAGAALSLAACGGATTSTAASSTTPTTKPPVTAPSSGAPAAASTGGINATETEFSISMSSATTTAGSHTFTVHNAGKETHALTVTGPGGVRATTGDIAPGGSGTVTVTLQAGRYDVFCPVADHKMLGMNTSLTVT